MRKQSSDEWNTTRKEKKRNFYKSIQKYLAEFIGTCVPVLLVGGEAPANVWVFLVAPLVGGILAALVYKFLAPNEK